MLVNRVLELAKVFWQRSKLDLKKENTCIGNFESFLKIRNLLNLLTFLILVGFSIATFKIF